MNEEHRKILRENWVFLMENLTPDQLLDHLLQGSIISQDMYDEIRSKATRKEQTTHLLFIIQRRGPHAFNNLLIGLRNTEQAFIADQLTQTLNGYHAQPMQL